MVWMVYIIFMVSIDFMAFMTFTVNLAQWMSYLNHHLWRIRRAKFSETQQRIENCHRLWLKKPLRRKNYHWVNDPPLYRIQTYRNLKNIMIFLHNFKIFYYVVVEQIRTCSVLLKFGLCSKFDFLALNINWACLIFVQRKFVFLRSSVFLGSFRHHYDSSQKN